MFKTKYGFGFLNYLLLFSVAPIFMSVFAGQDQQRAFNVAWQKFEDGDYEAAEVLVNHYLDERPENRHLQANFLYLKAFLQLTQPGLHLEAIANFQQARLFYEEVGSFEGAFSANIGLATVYFDEGLRDEAESTLLRYLSEAKQHNTPLGYTYALLTDLAFQQEDFRQALEYAVQSETAYIAVGDDMGMAVALSRQGLLLMASGQWRLGYQTTLRAQTLIDKMGDPIKRVYTLPNLILFKRCRGIDVSDLVSEIESHIEWSQDEASAWLLDFAQNHDCLPEEMGFENNPPRPSTPPPPPPPD